MIVKSNLSLSLSIEIFKQSLRPVKSGLELPKLTQFYISITIYILAEKV